MKDLIIGAITNYNFDAIRPWVNSLDRSGFTGDKAILCYNVDFATVNELLKRNYKVFAFNKDAQNQRFTFPMEPSQFSIVVQRFFHMWHFLKELKGQYRYMVATDVKDVIFQSNPIGWIETNIDDKKFIASSESIKYADETWGSNNIQAAFGSAIHSHYASSTIWNAGVQAGQFDFMLDLFLNIYLLCNGTAHFTLGGGGPDQAALNILLGLDPYRSCTKFASSEEGFSAQLGTTGPQIKERYGSKLIEKSPILVDGQVCTSDGRPFCIVHQYDRVPDWKRIMEEKYNELHLWYNH